MNLWLLWLIHFSYKVMTRFRNCNEVTSKQCTVNFCAIHVSSIFLLFFFFTSSIKSQITISREETGLLKELKFFFSSSTIFSIVDNIHEVHFQSSNLQSEKLLKLFSSYFLFRFKFLQKDFLLCFCYG